MRDERTRRCAAVERLHHWRLDLDKALLLQLPAQRGNDFSARNENLARLRIRNEIQIALAVACFHVFQAVPLLRHG